MGVTSSLSLCILILLALNNMQTTCSVKMRCMEKERQALLMIKQELVDEYDHLSSWGNQEHNKDCCTWRGISCSNRTGHVVTLNLSFGNFPIDRPLRGKISASLVELRHLNYLDLSKNDFGGQQIPEFIGSLNKLRHLDLSFTNFSGRVPYQLGNLSSLQTLDLSIGIYNSRFQYGPYVQHVYAEKLEWLSHLFSLRHLALNFVDLSAATDWLQVISGLPSLTELELQLCDLASVTTSSISFFNSSKSLASLDFYGNNLSSTIYSWLYHYSSSLVLLDLSYSDLQGPVPDHIFSNMTSLLELYLIGNNIEGTLKSFRNLCRLKVLMLTKNYLTGQLPELFYNSSSCMRDTLERLFLDHNMLSGSLPDFTGFSSLELLDISENEFNGTISKSIGQLVNLASLDVHLNSLEGMVTEALLSNLSRLIFLDLSQNLLSLNFIPNWHPPFQLVFLRLSACKLGPLFPKWIQTQSSVSFLDISNAGILGSVPDWFWDFSPNLYRLNLSHNRLSGMLPDLSLKLSGEPSIDLSSNRFEGSIPPMPPTVMSLFLSKNRFSGSISFLCGINGTLRDLDLSDNHLSGEMPNCFRDWQNLYMLNLGNNNFSGQIPNRMGLGCSIRGLDLNNNGFVGELPSTLKNCRELKFLNLANNKLSGRVPAWIGDNLQYLIILSLRSNLFGGNLPIQLCNMAYIQILDFSLNNISGTIPKCLNKLTAMVHKESSTSAVIISNGPDLMGEGDDRGYFADDISYQARIQIFWKELMSEFGNTLGLVKTIDLSSNKLVGVIPQEITSLVGLISLNLSSNNLSGPIPPNIGQLNLLNSLDLSENMLTGKVPDSFSQLDSLGYLNLSNNNFSGKIPSSTKPQSFDASSYLGNIELCGVPLPKKCSEDEPAPGPENQGQIIAYDNEEGVITQGFYVSMALGFIIGFWGVCGTLFLKKSWRHAYFQFLSDMKDKLFALMAVNLAKLHRG